MRTNNVSWPETDLSSLYTFAMFRPATISFEHSYSSKFSAPRSMCTKVTRAVSSVRM